MERVNQIDLDLAFGQALNLDLVQIFQALMLALICGAAVAVIYRISIPDRIASPAMLVALVLLAGVGAMVMMVIGNNIARAFSLVGALAIVRFRTRLASPLDITFVFFTLAAGIAAGVFAYQVAALGTAVVGLAALALQAFVLLTSQGPGHLLRFDLAAYQGAEGTTLQVLDRHVRRRSLVEARSLRFGETLSYRYRIVLRRDRTLEPLLREMSDVEGVERVIIDAREDRGDPAE
jgi:hypothetical protein